MAVSDQVADLPIVGGKIENDHGRHGYVVQARQYEQDHADVCFEHFGGND